MKIKANNEILGEKIKHKFSSEHRKKKESKKAKITFIFKPLRKR